jgi:hypothetical protein
MSSYIDHLHLDLALNPQSLQWSSMKNFFPFYFVFRVCKQELVLDVLNHNSDILISAKAKFGVARERERDSLILNSE